MTTTNSTVSASPTPDFESLRAAVSCRMCGLDYDSFEYSILNSELSWLYSQEDELRAIDARLNSIAPEVMGASRYQAEVAEREYIIAAISDEIAALNERFPA